MCTENGVNTTLTSTGENILRAMDLYEERTGSRMQWICQLPPDRQKLGLVKHMKQQIQLAADNRAICAFVQGAVTGQIFEEGKIEELREFIALIREKGMVPGICSHRPDVIEKAEELDMGAEFYMLTLNRVGYVCDDPEAAKRAVKTIDKPFINFKVLGAGRDDPESGFRNAFDAGATYLAVGMFDFQVKEDAELVSRILG